jgi:c-di-GMP-binding flagellar brake protein YcgR
VNGIGDPAQRAPRIVSPADAARECWELLSALRALRAHLWLGRSGEASAGLSVILGVEPERGEFTVDGLRDDAHWPPGTPLYFDTQVEGRRLRFECELAEHRSAPGNSLYRMIAPRLVVDQQRRNAYRVRVSPALRLPAALRRGASALPARVLDLSTRGCSTRVEAAGDIGEGEHLRVRIPLDGLELMCTATVRHTERMPGATRLGMEFNAPVHADAQALDQAVARLQREILRRRQAG